MITIIIGAGTVLLILSLLWYQFVEELLRHQLGKYVGKKAVVSAELDLTVASAYLENIMSSKPDKGVVFFSTQPKSTTELITYDIDREISITYECVVYVNETFPLHVCISALENDKPSNVPSNTQLQNCTLEGGKLQFKALEELPFVQVELKFAEGDFFVNRSLLKQKLQKNTDTVFEFLLKARKAEACPLMLVVSYVADILVPERIEKKIITSKKDGDIVTETIQQETWLPISKETKTTEVKLIPLSVKVRNLFGLTDDQLHFWQKALGPIVAVAIIIMALLTGRTENDEALALLIMALVNVVGVPIFPEIKALFTK